MNRCPQLRRVQPWLDDDLGPAEASAFRAHLASCAECAAELAAFERVVALVGHAPAWDPGPALTERILDRVVPSRVLHRALTVIGWVYTTVTAVSTFWLASWLSRPGTPAWIAARVSDLYVHALQAGLLALHTLVEGWAGLGRGWTSLEAARQHLAPLTHALLASLAEPFVGTSIAAALTASVLLIWWMRPRPRMAGRTAGDRKGIVHVDLLV